VVNECVTNSVVLFIRLSIDPLCEVLARDGSHLIRMKPLKHFLQVDYMKCCMHKLSNLQKVDLRKSPLKLWTCKRLKFN